GGQEGRAAEAARAQRRRAGRARPRGAAGRVARRPRRQRRGAAARRGRIRRRREVLRQPRPPLDRSRFRGPTHRGMNPKARQELIGIAALLVGFFLGLTLLPVALTGSWGRATGGALWQVFGVGAIVVPILGIGWALAAFGRLGR